MNITFFWIGTHSDCVEIYCRFSEVFCRNLHDSRLSQQHKTCIFFRGTVLTLIPRTLETLPDALKAIMNVTSGLETKLPRQDSYWLPVSVVENTTCRTNAIQLGLPDQDQYYTYKPFYGDNRLNYLHCLRVPAICRSLPCLQKFSSTP
jgi:hypothetical protein